MYNLIKNIALLKVLLHITFVLHNTVTEIYLQALHREILCSFLSKQTPTCSWPLRTQIPAVDFPTVSV